MSEAEPDYLEVDQTIPGQSYVCLSFVSPEKIFAKKESFFCKQFMKDLFRRYQTEQEHEIPNRIPLFRENIDTAKIIDSIPFDEWYDDFLYANEQALTKQFSEENQHMTSVRALKIRGSYETKQEAEYRAKQLQRRDPKFHVFVGQVGYWLPWDPNPDHIQNQEYLNDQLNVLMKKYTEQRQYKDEAFIQDKETRKTGKQTQSSEESKKNIEALRTIANRKDEIIEQSKDAEMSSKIRALAKGIGPAAEIFKESVDPWLQAKQEQITNTNTNNNHATTEDTETERRKQIKNITKSLF